LLWAIQKRSTAAVAKCKQEYKSADINNNSNNAEAYPATCGFVTPEESANRGYSITNDYAVATAATKRPASDSVILKAPRTSATSSTTHRKHIKSLQQLATESIYSKDTSTTATGSNTVTGSSAVNSDATDHHEAVAELYQQLKALHVTKRKVRKL
jgi:hypothetical protein